MRCARRTVAIALVALSVAVALTGCATARTVAGGTPGASGPVELNVSAASSLKSVLESTAPAFERANGVKLAFNFGASGALEKQIEGGAPADTFLSASPSQVATLVAKGLVSRGATETLAGNDLVIIVPQGNPAGIHGPADLAKAKKLATGDPAVAPHGAKAKEWLSGLGLWERLVPVFVFAQNAGQTDEYVSRGEVDAAIGFASDAKGRTDIEVAYVVSAGEYAPIHYVAAVVGTTKQPTLAQAYARYLLSAEAQSAFVSAGFKPAPSK